MKHYHTPVMVDEVLAALQVKADGKYIDCTAGEGGHSLAILQAATPAPRVLSIDIDGEALETAAERIRGYGDNSTIRQANYSEVAQVAAETGFMNADGLLLDLGLSSLQLDKGERGFSFRHEAPLDMRFDKSQGITADTIVNRYDEQKLADIIYRYGEERRSRRIARTIVRSRPVRTTTQLADIVLSAVGRQRGRINPATRTFQAIRIAVNDELGNVQRGLDAAVDTLGVAGRLVVITYHSIEDRIVKNAIRHMASNCICPPSVPQCACDKEPTVRIINRRVIRPSNEEVRANPRSRSARIRIAERL
ncbi:MAG: 16S rRNA (cytosine(1402)-N(4))-methyltransferase RsmH [Chloroflexota bacterium]|nr:16S rRNA (cytosine(1402)-N(4))-methyltransferase RsmH [Chloroflexota bacterium]